MLLYSKIQLTNLVNKFHRDIDSYLNKVLIIYILIKCILIAKIYNEMLIVT